MSLLLLVIQVTFVAKNKDQPGPQNHYSNFQPINSNPNKTGSRQKFFLKNTTPKNIWSGRVPTVTRFSSRTTTRVTTRKPRSIKVGALSLIKFQSKKSQKIKIKSRTPLKNKTPNFMARNDQRRYCNSSQVPPPYDSLEIFIEHLVGNPVGSSYISSYQLHFCISHRPKSYFYSQTRSEIEILSGY